MQEGQLAQTIGWTHGWTWLDSGLLKTVWIPRFWQTGTVLGKSFAHLYSFKQPCSSCFAEHPGYQDIQSSASRDHCLSPVPGQAWHIHTCCACPLVYADEHWTRLHTPTHRAHLRRASAHWQGGWQPCLVLDAQHPDL